MILLHISYSIIDAVAPSTTRTTRHDRTSHCDVLFPSEKYRISSTWGDQKMVGSSWKMVGLHGIMGVWETYFEGQLNQRSWRCRNLDRYLEVLNMFEMFPVSNWWWQINHKVGACFITLHGHVDLRDGQLDPRPNSSMTRGALKAVPIWDSDCRYKQWCLDYPAAPHDNKPSG